MEPNLVDDRLTQDDLDKEAEQMKGVYLFSPGLQTTETDMHFEAFANSDKLVTENKREYFQKPDRILSPIRERTSERETSYHHDDHRTDHHEDKSDHRTEHKTDHDTDIKSDRKTDEPSKPKQSFPVGSQEERLEKYRLLRFLSNLSKHGVKPSADHDMNSSYATVKREYDLQTQLAARENGIQWCSNTLMVLISGMEMLNEDYNPFKLQLKGWSASVSSQLEGYYQIFADLYDMYAGDMGGMSPWVKLILMLCGSALTFHFTQKMFSGMPSMDQAMQGGLLGALTGQGGPPKDPKEQMQKKMASDRTDAENQAHVLNRLDEGKPPIHNYAQQRDFAAQMAQMQQQLNQTSAPMPAPVSSPGQMPTGEQRIMTGPKFPPGMQPLTSQPPQTAASYPYPQMSQQQALYEHSKGQQRANLFHLQKSQHTNDQDSEEESEDEVSSRHSTRSSRSSHSRHLSHHASSVSDNKSSGMISKEYINPNLKSILMVQSRMELDDEDKLLSASEPTRQDDIDQKSLIRIVRKNKKRNKRRGSHSSTSP
jgi:hypothetical protein